MKLLVKPKANRALMRIQRKSKVIEPHANEHSDDSSDEELNLAIDQESEKPHKYNLKTMLDLVNGGDLENAKAAEFATFD